MNFSFIRKELFELRRSFLPWFLVFIIVTGLITSYKVPVMHVRHEQTKYVVFSEHEKQTLVAQFFSQTKKDLLPKGVELISTSPITVFLVQIKMALLIAFALTSPYLFFSLMTYISPALRKKEKRILLIAAFLASLLFISGIIFAYMFLVQSMFSVLLSFNTDLEVKPYLLVDEFMSWTLAALFMTGILFLLPLFMYVFTALRIVSSYFWASRWREVFVIFLVISSIITPDVSGVSIILLTIPMIILYTIGIIVSSYTERKRKQKENI